MAACIKGGRCRGTRPGVVLISFSFLSILLSGMCSLLVPRYYLRLAQIRSGSLWLFRFWGCLQYFLMFEWDWQRRHQLGQLNRHNRWGNVAKKKMITFCLDVSGVRLEKPRGAIFRYTPWSFHWVSLGFIVEVVLFNEQSGQVHPLFDF